MFIRHLIAVVAVGLGIVGVGCAGGAVDSNDSEAIEAPAAEALQQRETGTEGTLCCVPANDVGRPAFCGHLEGSGSGNWCCGVIPNDNGVPVENCSSCAAYGCTVNRTDPDEGPGKPPSVDWDIPSIDKVQ